jgi:ubiquinone/menaquinone biosynthesis C-methylase UbiE
MKQLDPILEPFETHTQEYDAWFDEHPYVFKSEVEALREMLPAGESHGIEVGLGTGRFSVALGMKEGVEPSFYMRKMAYERGIEVMDAIAEKLPYKALHFDFVLMASCISYFFNMKRAFEEANRVLKKNGSLIIGFIEKESLIGKEYAAHKSKSTFYKQANFYECKSVIKTLETCGFGRFEFSQTLFHSVEETLALEPAKPGFGQGSFVVIKAVKLH